MSFLLGHPWRTRSALALEKPLPVSTHRQCERCAAQWALHPRYGWALSPHTLFGCASFVCPDCQRRRA